MLQYFAILFLAYKAVIWVRGIIDIFKSNIIIFGSTKFLLWKSSILNSEKKWMFFCTVYSEN